MSTAKHISLFVPLYLVSFLAVLVENGGHWGSAALVAGAVAAVKFLIAHVHEGYWAGK
jgi:hypothetical protein